MLECLSNYVLMRSWPGSMVTSPYNNTEYGPVELGASMKCATEESGLRALTTTCTVGEVPSNQ